MAPPSAESKMPDITRMVEAFKIAAEKGSSQPQVRIKGFTFKLATRGATPGAVFVLRDEHSDYPDYLGKFWKGKFGGTNKLRPGEETRILRAAANPLEAIVEFGRQTGKCGICNRKLTDPVSVKNGIGPICQERFGL